MPTDDLRGIAPETECSYLPAETASLEYRYCSELDVADYEELLARGWRRQGMCVFRPACLACRKCRSLRVDVQAFRPSKSQRRCLRKNRDVRLVVRRATVSNAHIELFRAYHADMHRRRGWEPDATTATDYARSFLAGRFPFASEFAYYHRDDLIGIGLVDATPTCLSSVYFYHDPEWRPDSPGTFSMLRELEFAKETGRRWLYLGYWIAQNQSMSYKNRFTPHELLERYVPDEEVPCWVGG